MTSMRLIPLCFLAVVLLSSCVSSYVNNIGKTYTEITTAKRSSALNQILYTRNGAIAIPVEIGTFKQGIVYDFLNPVVRRKGGYVWGSADTLTRSWRIHEETHRLPSASYKEVQEIRVVLLTTSPLSGWQLVPYNRTDRPSDATNTLPPDFDEATRGEIDPSKISQIMPLIPLKPGGNQFANFYFSIPYDHYFHKSFWFYPAQILLIPAVVIDALTSPFQIGPILGKGWFP